MHTGLPEQQNQLSIEIFYSPAGLIIVFWGIQVRMRVKQGANLLTETRHGVLLHFQDEMAIVVHFT